jgi:hypothetical protein
LHSEAAFARLDGKKCDDRRVLRSYRSCSDLLKEDPVEDREKVVKPMDSDDVEAHKVSPKRGEEAPAEDEGTDDDVELHRSKNSSKL